MSYEPTPVEAFVADHTLWDPTFGLAYRDEQARAIHDDAIRQAGSLAVHVRMDLEGTATDPAFTIWDGINEHSKRSKIVSWFEDNR